MYQSSLVFIISFPVLLLFTWYHFWFIPERLSNYRMLCCVKEPLRTNAGWSCKNINLGCDESTVVRQSIGL